MNAAEALAREILRVAKVRGEYVALDGMSGVNVNPAVTLMDMSLERACKAAGNDDAIETLACLEDLRGFTL